MCSTSEANDQVLEKGAELMIKDFNLINIVSNTSIDDHANDDGLREV